MKKLGRLILIVQLLYCGFCPVLAALPNNRDREHGAEADSGELQMIAERMAALTGSLQEMPQLPKLDAVIVFPERRDDGSAAASAADEEGQSVGSKKKARGDV